jgi:tRNA threonylcarbamoyladenosine biosynthesis protein TsaE
MPELPAPSDTHRFGHELGAASRAGDVIALCGELGAGKTELVKGIAAGLGHSGDVTSPTFTLVHEYRGGRLDVFHFDFYRIESVDEIPALGFDEYLAAGGLCVVEWADRFPGLIPPHATWWRLSRSADGGRTAEPMSPP